MLSRENRLNKLFFNITKRKGKIISRNPKIIYLQPRNPEFRASIVISKKSLKKAVDRNRLRRRIYSALRLLSDTRPNGWYIIYAKPEWIDIEFEKLKQNLITELNNKN